MTNTSHEVGSIQESKHKSAFKPITGAHHPKNIGIDTHGANPQYGIVIHGANPQYGIDIHGANKKIFVKTLTGHIISLDVNLCDTIASIKQSIQDKKGVHASEQSLMSAGKKLENDSTIGDCNIQDGSAINMVLRRRGGTYYVNGSISTGGNNQSTGSSP